MAVAEHRSAAPSKSSVRVAVVSVSDTRTPQTDEGGALVEALATQAGFRVVGRELVRDQPGAIRDRVRDLAARGGGGGGGDVGVGVGVDVDVILVTGGTGIAPRDGTVEAIAPLFARRLDGFGELFRMLSFAEIGPAAMLSRATAGIVGDVLIFLMPGSPAGVRLAMERLILPELAHLVGELRKAPTAEPARASDAPDGSRSNHHGHRHDDRERR